MEGKASCLKLATIAQKVVFPRLTGVRNRDSNYFDYSHQICDGSGYILTVQSGGQSGGGKVKLPKTVNYRPRLSKV